MKLLATVVQQPPGILIVDVDPATAGGVGAFVMIGQSPGMDPEILAERILDAVKTIRGNAK
jgi:hypothetical protein